MLENGNRFREELQELFAAWKTTVLWKVEAAQPLFLMLAKAKTKLGPTQKAPGAKLCSPNQNELQLGLGTSKRESKVPVANGVVA